MDSLALVNVGTTFTKHTYNYANATDGDIVLSDGTNDYTINYFNLAPLSNDGTPDEIIFNLPGATDNSITLEHLSPGWARLTTTVPSFEQTDFAYPAANGSITINMGDNAQTITVGDLELNANTSLTIDGEAGTDTINLNAPSGLTITGDLTLSAETIAQTNPVAVTGTTSLTAGTGTITLADLDNDFQGTVTVVSSLDTVLADQNTLTIGGISAANDVTLEAGQDLLVNGDVIAGGEIELLADRDVIIGATVQTTGTGSITVIADYGLAGFPDGSGGVRILDTGFINSRGDVYIEGSDLNATPTETDAVVVDADGTTAQILAAGNIDIFSGFFAPADADVIINGRIETTGSSYINVTAANDAIFGLNGDLTADGNISVIAGGHIVMADGTVFDAGSGTIELTTAGGDISLGGLVSTSAADPAIAINAVAGAVVDAGDSDIDIVAPNGSVVIVAANGIGSANALETQVSTLVATNSTIGNIFIQEVDGLIIGGTGVQTLAGNGNIDIDVDAGDLTIDSVVTAHGSGTVTLNVDAGAADLNAAVSSTTGQIDITGDSVNQNAGGNISTGDGAPINVTAEDGSITMADGTTTTAGSGLITYRATEDVALSSLSTTGNVRVTADSDNNGTGAITDNTAAETANIAADQVALRAGSGIGDGEAPNVLDIDLEVNSVAAVTRTGDIHLQDLSGGLSIDTFDGLSGVTTTIGSASDHITIRTTGPLTVTTGDPVLNNGGDNITLAAEGSLITDDLTINANVTATSGNGNISLYAGDSISLASTVTVGAAGSGDILLSASTDFNDGSTQNGYNGGAGDASTAGRVMMADGAIVQSIGGDITLRGDGDVLLSRVVAFSGDVTVIADYDGVGIGMSDGDGAIIDNTAAEIENIRGQLAILRAATGIGSGGGDADIETMITTLDAINTTSGDIAINEVAGGVSMTVRRAWQQGASGSIALSTERGNITVIQTGGFGIQVQNAANTSGSVLVDANVTVPATDEPLRGNIIVNHVVTTQGGEIAIRADHDITGITAGVITSNGGSIEITADANNAGPAGDRGTIQLNGLVAGTSYDQLTVNGTVDLSGVLPDGVGGAILTGTFATAPPVGGEYRIIDNDDTDDIIGRFAGLAEGAFFTLDGFLLNISYFSGTGNDVTLTGPGRYDFDAGVPITTEPFYESVPQGQLYGPGTGAGWVGTATGGTARFVSEGGSLPADPNTPWRMFRDVHFGQNGVFQVDVVRDTPDTTGLYQVTIVSGDYGHPHNASQFRVGPAGGPLSDPLTTSTNVNEFSTLVFRNVYIPPGATDIGQLVVEMVYAGSNSLWNAVINGLDIRPMSSVGLITLNRTSAGTDPLSADALLTDTYTGGGAPPDTLITIAATGGQLVTADADQFYDKAHELNLDGGLPTDFVTSIQVLSDPLGNFTFDLQRPTSDQSDINGDGVGDIPGVRIVAFESSGLSFGEMTQAFTLDDSGDSAPTVLRFDFGTGISPVATGFLEVVAGQLYDDATGYGWDATPPNALDRGAFDSDLRRDFHYGTDHTFRIKGTPNEAYNLRIYMMDSFVGHDQLNVSINGAQVITDANTTTPVAPEGGSILAAGLVIVQDVSGTADAQGHLDVRFWSAGGIDQNFVINGIDVSSGALPAAQTLSVVDSADSSRWYTRLNG